LRILISLALEQVAQPERAPAPVSPLPPAAVLAFHPLSYTPWLAPSPASRQSAKSHF
jgi:hypothetical protein